MHSPKKDMSRLRALFEAQEEFPIDYTHKFIGKNTPAFDRGVAEWKKKFTPIKCPSDRLSANQAHRSLTFVLRMENVDALIAMLEGTDDIPDLVMVL